MKPLWILLGVLGLIVLVVALSLLSNATLTPPAAGVMMNPSLSAAPFSQSFTALGHVDIDVLIRCCDRHVGGDRCARRRRANRATYRSFGPNAGSLGYVHRAYGSQFAYEQRQCRFGNVDPSRVSGKRGKIELDQRLSGPLRRRR